MGPMLEWVQRIHDAFDIESTLAFSAIIAVLFASLAGIVGAGVEEPNAIVQLETGAATVPNARATEVILYDGLVASTTCLARTFQTRSRGPLRFFGAR